MALVQGKVPVKGEEGTGQWRGGGGWGRDQIQRQNRQDTLAWTEGPVREVAGKDSPRLCVEPLGKWAIARGGG